MHKTSWFECSTVKSMQGFRYPQFMVFCSCSTGKDSVRARGNTRGRRDQFGCGDDSLWSSPSEYRMMNGLWCSKQHNTTSDTDHYFQETTHSRKRRWLGTENEIYWAVRFAIATVCIASFPFPFQFILQWNPSIADTMGPPLRVQIIEVSVFQRLLVYFRRRGNAYPCCWALWRHVLELSLAVCLRERLIRG